MKNPNNYPIAGCVLIVSGDRILGVSRRDNSSQWGVPGGKAEEGETATEAASRECWEETGVIVKGLRLIYEGECAAGSDGKAFFTSTFLADTYLGEPKQMGEGLVSWISADDLLSGPFATYNARLLDSFKKYRESLDVAPSPL